MVSVIQQEPTFAFLGGGSMAKNNPETVDMATESDVTTLHLRIDRLAEDIKGLVTAVNEIHSDVRVMSTTCTQRGRTCAAKVDSLDRAMRGNGKVGVEVRLDRLEKDQRNEKKKQILLFSCCASGTISLVVGIILTFLRTN